MKKLIITLIILIGCNFGAIAQDYAYVDTNDSYSKSSENYSSASMNEEMDIKTFEKKYLKKANKITKENLKSSNPNFLCGSEIGCVYGNKLYWTGWKMNLKNGEITEFYLYKADLDFSKMKRKKIKFSPKNVMSFQERLKKDFF